MIEIEIEFEMEMETSDQATTKKRLCNRLLVERVSGSARLLLRKRGGKVGIFWGENEGERGYDGIDMGVDDMDGMI